MQRDEIPESGPGKHVAGAGGTGCNSLHDLLAGYYEYDGSGKERVIAAFRESADPLVFPLLETALRNNRNDKLRNAAMEMYVALHRRSLPFLVALLLDGNEEVRTFSAVMLGTMKDSSAVPALIRALEDTDMNVKHAAAEALGKIGDRRAVEPLICLLSTDMWLQFPAAIALGDIGDSRAVAPLVTLLDMPGANVPAIQALGKLAHLSALEPLSAYLSDDEPSLREWALEAVVETLVKNGSDAPVPPLTDRAKELLIDALKPDRPGVRKNAAIALGCFRVREAVPALRDLLRDEDLNETARASLARIQGTP
jgi:HEAT repeat protein